MRRRLPAPPGPNHLQNLPFAGVRAYRVRLCIRGMRNLPRSAADASIVRFCTPPGRPYISWPPFTSYTAPVMNDE